MAVRVETVAVATRFPGCVHQFGPVERGKYARWVRRCVKCRGVATVRFVDRKGER